MESFEALATKEFTQKQFLNYYINIWNRNVAARLIDVQTDLTKKEANPDELVELDGKVMKIGERVELRKILVQDAMDIYNAAKKLYSLPDLDLAHLSSVEGLRVAEDMLPVAPETPMVEVPAEARPDEVITLTPEVTVEEPAVAVDPIAVVEESVAVVETPAEAPVESVSPEATV